jgi:hypothetical protein
VRRWTCIGSGPYLMTEDFVCPPRSQGEPLPAASGAARTAKRATASARCGASLCAALRGARLDSQTGRAADHRLCAGTHVFEPHSYVRADRGEDAQVYDAGPSSPASLEPAGIRGKRAGLGFAMHLRIWCRVRAVCVLT